MDDRPRLRLPFGAGVDRSAGQYAVAPGVPRTLLDVLAEEGRVEARKGLSPTVSITLQNLGAPATDLVHVMPFRAAGRGMITATFLPDPTSGPNYIEFWRTSATGFNPVYVGLMASPTTPPKLIVARIFGAEANAQLFYAHDEPDIGSRAVTRAITSAFVVSNLMADLDGAGSAVVRFRGVARYGDYLLGWGFGSASDPDRPEVLRFSLPGDPLTFRSTRYAQAGAKAEPILNCVPGDGFVWVLKETETYLFRGTNATNFRIDLLDPTFGLAGSHLACVVEGELFGWSRQGPRVWNAGGSVDLGLPLDLDGPSPASLVEAGEADYGWAVYDAVRRLVLFGFPNRDLGLTRVYVLSRRDPSAPRWTYFEFQRAIMSAGLLFAVQAGAPSGYPDQSALSSASTDVTVTWTNVGAVGDEVVEVWLKVGAGSYAKVREVAVLGAGQSITLTLADGVALGALHTVALRYRRGVEFTSGYAGIVTSGWSPTAISQSVESITTASAPTAPTAALVDDCMTEVFGGKTYVSFKAGWTNAVATGDTEVLTGTVNDPDTATVADSVAVSGLGFAQTSNWFGGWWTAGGGSPWYVWVRHVVAGVPSAAVALAGTPLNPADGCAL